MTDPIEAARLEHEHPGRHIPESWTDRWFKQWQPHVRVVRLAAKPGDALTGQNPTMIVVDELAEPKFNPLLVLRLLKSSNAMTFADGRGHRDGRFDEPGTTRHAGYVYQREPK